MDRAYFIRKQYAERMTVMRSEYPYPVLMMKVLDDGKEFATKAQVEKCKEHFSYTDAVINRKIAWFKNQEDAVYFLMGAWLLC